MDLWVIKCTYYKHLYRFVFKAWNILSPFKKTGTKQRKSEIFVAYGQGQFFFQSKKGNFSFPSSWEIRFYLVVYQSEWLHCYLPVTTVWSPSLFPHFGMDSQILWEYNWRCELNSWWFCYNLSLWPCGHLASLNKLIISIWLRVLLWECTSRMSFLSLENRGG